MMAFFSDGRPSDGQYFTSPWLSFAAELRMAGMGVLFLGSPMPRWMTGSPRSRSSRASSFSRSVGDSTMELASSLTLMVTPVGACGGGLGRHQARGDNRP